MAELEGSVGVGRDRVAGQQGLGPQPGGEGVEGGEGAEQAVVEAGGTHLAGRVVLLQCGAHAHPRRLGDVHEPDARQGAHEVPRRNHRPVRGGGAAAVAGSTVGAGGAGGRPANSPYTP